MAEATTEERVLEATRRYLERRGDTSEDVQLDDSVCQDLMIFGVDVEDYVDELESDFGKVVWTIPWAYYTDQRGSYRGCMACIVAPVLIPWALLKRVFPGFPGLNPPDAREHPHRLTLREIAAAIEAGGWPQDWQPE